MPCTLLVKATDGDGTGSKGKGDVVTVKDEPWAWGAKEGLPDFIRVTISDATAAQVANFLDAWPTDYQFSIVNQNASGWRFRVEVDPAYISATGVGRDVLKSEMTAWVTEPYEGGRGAGGTVVSFAVDSMTCDIPKTGLGSAEDLVKRAELKARFSDRFATLFQPARYHFAASDVDTVVASGGLQTLSRAQAQAVIVDRLAL